MGFYRDETSTRRKIERAQTQHGVLNGSEVVGQDFYTTSTVLERAMISVGRDSVMRQNFLRGRWQGR